MRLSEKLPLVTVVVPSRNSEATIEKCLKSLRNQSYGNIEIIVVDNFSTDNTKAIAKKYADRILLKGPERGSQVNFGAGQAKGKYVYRVDSDFVLHPNIVSDAVALSERFGYDAIIIHNTSDASISFWAKVRKMERDSYKNDELNVAARFWKKEVFLAVGGFDESFVAGEDYDLQNRLVKEGFKFGWIGNEEIHIGEPKTLAEVATKYYYYGKDIVYFVRKNQRRALMQLSPFRSSLAKALPKFSNEPALLLGFLLYQFSRYSAAVIGMISEVILPKSPIPSGEPKRIARSRLIQRVKMKPTKLLIIVFFLVLNLRLLLWFQPGYVLTHGDFRPPLTASAFLGHALEPVNHVDFGITSVYAPRLLDPFTDVMLALEYIGVATWASELVATFVAYVTVSLLVYVLLKRLTYNSVAAFIGAFFFTTNVFLVVDEGQIAVGYMELALALLPCIVAFVEALHRNSARFALLAGLLFSFSFSFYPNYRQVLLTILSITVIGIFYVVRSAISVSNIKIKARLAGLFALAGGASSSWIIALAAISYGSFQAAFNQAYGPQLYLSFNPSLFDTFRLIAKWSFYSSALGRPYIPYASEYLNNSVVVALTLVPTILAFASLLLTKQRKTAIYYSVVALVFLLLTGGVVSLAGLPLMVVFRETFNYMWVALLSLSVLIGLTAASIYDRAKKRKYQYAALVVVVALLCVPAYPMFTGEVSRGLDADHKGSFIPPYFNEVNKYVDDYMLLLPERRQYVVYDFASKGWLVVGNVYPMTFNVPYVSGIGTEYLQSQQPDRVRLCYDAALLENGTEAAEVLYKQGIRYILAENSIIFGNVTTLGNYTTLLSSNTLRLVKAWSEAILYRISP